MLHLIVGDTFVIGLRFSQVLDRIVKDKLVFLHFGRLPRVSVSRPLSLLLFAVPGGLVPFFKDCEPVHPAGEEGRDCGETYYVSC